MKTVQISDELYDSLKNFVVDPFDDTPEAVINRVVDIASKARLRCSPLEVSAAAPLPSKKEPPPDEPLVAL